MIELADNTQAAPPAVQPSLLDQLLDTLVQRVAAQVEASVLVRLAAAPPALTEERVVEIARAAADEAIDNHAYAYNHDEYDSVTNMLGDYDLDDFVSEDDLSRKVRGCVKDLTFTVSVEVD